MENEHTQLFHQSSHCSFAKISSDLRCTLFHYCTFFCQRHIWLRSPLPRSDLSGHRWRHCFRYLTLSFLRLKPELTAFEKHWLPEFRDRVLGPDCFVQLSTLLVTQRTPLRTSSSVYLNIAVGLHTDTLGDRKLMILLKLKRKQERKSRLDLINFGPLRHVNPALPNGDAGAIHIT